MSWWTHAQVSIKSKLELRLAVRLPLDYTPGREIIVPKNYNSLAQWRTWRDSDYTTFVVEL